jgi:hypothetical protein
MALATLKPVTNEVKDINDKIADESKREQDAISEMHPRIRERVKAQTPVADRRFVGRIAGGVHDGPLKVLTPVHRLAILRPTVLRVMIETLKAILLDDQSAHAWWWVKPIRITHHRLH